MTPVAMPVATDRPVPTISATKNSDIIVSPVPTESPKPNVERTVQVTPAPTAAPTLTPTSSLNFYDQALGVTFNYPRDWEILPRGTDEPPGVTVSAPGVGEGPEPIIFAVTIDVEPAPENSVKEIVDQQLEQVPIGLRSGIKRIQLTIDSVPAEEVIGLPAQEGAIATFILYKGRVYLVVLQPYDESNVSLVPFLPEKKAQYGDLISSWRFLK